MPLFNLRKRPNAAELAPIRRETAADRALAGLDLPRNVLPELPAPDKSHVPVPVEAANRKLVQDEMRTAARDAAERVTAARDEVAKAELELTKTAARVRFGESTLEDLERARAAVDAAQAPLREAQHYVDGGAEAVLDERRYLETAALIRANAERQETELRGLALCLALELQLERHLAVVRARRLAFTDSVHATTFTHLHALDTPERERAQGLIERVRVIVTDRLGFATKPATAQTRYSPQLEKNRAAERAMLAEQRWLSGGAKR